MANKTATFKINLTYEGPGGTSVAVAQKTVNVPYGASSAVQIDIPDGTTDGTSFPVPFGSIGTGATALYLINNTSNDLELTFNGSLVTFEVAAGGVCLVLQSDLPAGVPLTAATVVATATTVGVERVDCFVFGDPE